MEKKNTKKQNTVTGYAGKAAESAVRSAGSEVGKAAAKAVLSGAARRAVKTAIRRVGMGLPLFNHPDWYVNDTTAGLVGLNFATNKSLKYPLFNTYKDLETDYQTGVPSVVGITTIDTPSWDPAGNDGWSAGITQIRSALAAANNASTNYDERDLERYVIHLVYMHTLAATGQRLLGVINHFDGYDTAVPRTYASALGFHYQSLVTNAADLRTSVQQLISFIATAAPLKCDLIERKRWLYGNVFLDSEGPKATPILVTPSHIARCSASGEPTVVALGAFNTASRADVADFINQVRIAITNFSRNPTFAMIAGDMIKAYGRDCFYPDVDITTFESTKLQFIYDKQALAQFSNGIVVGNVTASYVANTNSVASGFLLTGEDTTRTAIGLAASERSTKYIINAEDDDVSAGEILSLTRFTCGTTVNEEDTEYDLTVTWRNSEVMHNVYFVVAASTNDDIYPYVDNNYAMATRMHSSIFVGQTTPTVADGCLMAIPSYWSIVEGLPATMLTYGSATHGVLQSTPMRHIDTFAYTTDQVIRSMNYTANKSLLNIPVRLRVARTELL